MEQSKHQAIKDALEKNQEILYFNIRNDHPTMSPLQCYVYWVAPKIELRKRDRLNQFIDNLISELEPEIKRPFERIGEKDLYLGRLIFKEIFGKEKITRECTLATFEAEDSFGFQNHKQTITKNIDYKRSISIICFPYSSLPEGLYKRGVRSLPSSPSIRFLEKDLERCIKTNWSMEHIRDIPKD